MECVNKKSEEQEIKTNRKRKQCIVKQTIRKEYLQEPKEIVSDLDSKELYKKTLLEINQCEEMEKQNAKYNVTKQMEKCDQVDENSFPRENGNKFTRFIIYLATEHETLLQILLLLPLILMSAYILVVEKGTLFRIVER